MSTAVDPVGEGCFEASNQKIQELKLNEQAMIILKEIAYQNTLIVKVLCEPKIIINKKEK